MSRFPLGFDTHCHLHFKDFDDDIETVVETAKEAGIGHILIPSVDLSSAQKSAALAERFNLFSAAAFHPDHLPKDEVQDSEWLSMRKILLRPNTIAVGETGLDFYHNTFSREKQILWFKKHIDFAEATGFPIVVHSRDAESEVLRQLPRNPSVPVILHCWNGNASLTSSAVERGFYIGVGGPLTYKKNTRLREIIADVPRNLLLVETDSPFLSPEPFRGKRNQPAHVAVVIRKIRELWGNTLSLEEVSYLLWNNAVTAYRIHPTVRRADILYRYGDSLYVNLTSRCQNNCTFCVRRFSDGLAGYFLRHREDPDERLVESSIGAFPIEDFPELVFCGFGEPTLRPELLVRSASMAKARGVATRLNTNGLCTSFLSDDEVRTLIDSFDFVNVSLNASGAKEYNRICPSSTPDAWKHLMKFISLAKRSDTRLQVSAVKNSGTDLQRITTFAKRLQVPLRLR